MAQQDAESGTNRNENADESYVARCLECGWTTTDADVIAVDEAAGAHEHEHNHLTTGPLTREEAKGDTRTRLPEGR